MISKPILLMMIGVPGSGKSTLANKLMLDILDFHAYYASTDEYIDAWAKDHGRVYHDVFTNLIKQATKDVEEKVREAVANHWDVCWDQTNISKKTRARKLKFFNEDYKKVAVNMLMPFNLQERLDSRPDKYIPKDVIEQMIKDYQPPSLDEGFDELWFYEDFKRVV